VDHVFLCTTDQAFHRNPTEQCDRYADLNDVISFPVLTGGGGGGYFPSFLFANTVHVMMHFADCTWPEHRARGSEGKCAAL
jgi:hypothetical protein